jgi:hypothetical protein
MREPQGVARVLPFQFDLPGVQRFSDENRKLVRPFEHRMLLPTLAGPLISELFAMAPAFFVKFHRDVERGRCEILQVLASNRDSLERLGLCLGALDLQAVRHFCPRCEPARNVDSESGAFQQSRPET